MALGSNDLSLLFRLRAQNQTGPAFKAAQSDVAKLRSQVGADFGQMQGVATTALSKITQSLGQFGGQIPLVGNAVGGLSSQLGTMTEATGSAATGLGAVAAPAAAAAIGIGLTVSAVTTLIQELFNVTKVSAEFRGKLFDMSQQTGVSVETLNALEIAASQTGGSIESVSQSLVIFQGHLDEAQDSSSKAGQLFRELGISTKDTETAFRDALTQLAKMPEGFHQTNSAAELFGRRGGKQVLAILKETKGDVDSAVSSLGSLAKVTREDARLADEFNDTLRQLSILLRGVTALVGREVMPVALKAVQDLSRALKDNREDIENIAKAIGVLSNLITGPLKGAIFVANASWEAAEPVLEVIAKLYERIASAVRAVRGTTDATQATPGIGGVEVGLGVDAAAKLPGLKTTIFGDTLKQSQDNANKELEIQRNLTENLRLVYETGKIDLQRFYDGQQTLINERLATLQKQITAEKEAADAAFGRGAIDQSELEDRQRDLSLRQQQAQNKRDEDTRRLTLERQRAEIQLELKHREQMSAIAEATRRGELNRIKVALDRQAITESDALTRQLEFLKEIHQERLGVINFELQAEGTSKDRKEELNNQKKVLEREYTDEFKRLTRERIDALNEEAAARAPGASGDFGDGRVQPGFEGDFAGPAAAADNTTSAIGQLGQAIEANLSGDTFSAAMAGLETMVTVFGELSNAVGSALDSFIKFGSAGTSFRKVVAEILSGVARMAATKAIFELAEGFAALALAFFGIPNAGPSAQAHFTAAAIYGSIAAVAAVAGRGVAGNAFQTSAGGGGGGGSSRASTASNKPETREVDRRQAQNVNLNVTVKRDPGSIVEVVVDDYKNNGPLRKMILTDGQG